MDIIDKLIKYSKRRRFNQRQLSEFIGIPQPFLCRCLARRQRLSIQVVARLPELTGNYIKPAECLEYLKK